MKKNRLLAGIVILLFICSAIFFPNINDIYNTTSQEIKDNLFKQKYLYKSTFFDSVNGYLYTFEKRNGTVKNIYTNEESVFEYMIKDDMLAVRHAGDAGYDIYDMTLYDDRIRIERDEKSNIDLLFQDKQSKSFDEFIFLESTDGKSLNDISANNITFFSDNTAIIKKDQAAMSFDYSIKGSIVTLNNKQNTYYFIGVSQKQIGKCDEALLGLYLSRDIQNTLELNEEYGYLAVNNSSVEFRYGVVGDFIVCKSSDGNTFILNYVLDNNTLEIKILPYDKQSDLSYTFTKVS